MGLLDIADSPEMGLAMGLMQAGGPSRMPVTLGQGIASGFEGMQHNQMLAAKRRMMEMQAKAMEQDLANNAEMKPLQIQQLKSQLEQAALQRKMAENFPAILESLRGGMPTPYKDQISPAQVGSVDAPTVNFNGKPEDYFKMAMAIPDPTEKQGAIEAGLRQWPQFRPNVSTGATSRDAATSLGGYGAAMAMAGLKGGDELIKFSGMLQPRELKEGTTYENPLNGKREFMPKTEVGMRPDGAGGYETIPGFTDFLRQKALANVDPVAEKRLNYETGMSLRGGEASPNGMSPKDAAAVRTGAYTGGNEDWLKNSYRPVMDKAASADGMLTSVQSLRNIDMNTGWGTEAKATAASVLEALGIAPQNAQMFAANAQKFQSQSMTRLWEVLNSAKGPQTEGDADRAKATFASLKNTKEANAFILDLAEATARRDKIKADFYAEAMPVARDSGDLTAVDRKWREKQRSVWEDPIMAKWRKQ